ncbi:glycosyl hydrolase family 8 [Couchioplanes caeruleus]|uniref:glycosyl hydrolase family 8 n=1 Tax=Couchioplanes caeruleus TaxID=56438 RepID=UPI00201C0384|nr:glycosyl hydrolase family 8 [Couchioplanes caeruleus]UQU67501.1 glycosyl hydrolase family 8 [Couchioplanes caeruleus]
MRTCTKIALGSTLTLAVVVTGVVIMNHRPDHPAIPATRFPAPVTKAYRAAMVTPSASPESQHTAVLNAYRAWKVAFIREGCGAGMRQVYSPDASYPYVAEGQGYGMVITVSMADLDPGAKGIFDGIVKFVLAHRSANDPDLTAAEQDDDCADQAGANSATDGDMDIAYGLLLADRAWGSSGKYDYRALAVRRIAAIKASEVNPSSKLMLLGDWSAAGNKELFGVSRTSDWMLEHFRAFEQATGDVGWGDIREAHLNAIAEVQAKYSQRTGLLPDFVTSEDGRTQPADGKVLESSRDGDYGYNACRTPWRIGFDAIVSGDPRSLAAARKMNAWFKDTAGGDPDNVGSGYSLAGGRFGSRSARAFWAPLAVAAMTDPGSQSWLDALWTKMASSSIEPDSYFGASVQLQAMLVASGHYVAASGALSDADRHH